MGVVVTDIKRVDAEIVSGFSGIGVATVHEAQGRKGLMAAHMRPVFRPIHVAGPAVTVEVAPGDNWMIHVAIEQCQPGDVMIVAPTSPCEDGYFGELLATSMVARGIKGFIIDAGILEKSRKRDADEADKRKVLQSGKLGLDIYNMRPRLAERGLTYVKSQD